MATVKIIQLENESEATEFEEHWEKNAVRLRNMLMLLAGYYDQNWFPVYIHIFIINGYDFASCA